MKIVTWNVNGIRAILRKGLKETIKELAPDVLCLQETKIDETLSDEVFKEICGSYHFSSAIKKGYSGVATFILNEELSGVQLDTQLGIDKFDLEGRLIVSDLGEVLLYNIYFPSGTSGEERQGYKYEFLDAISDHISALSKKDRERLVVCGDFNICHLDIDIHHPKEAERRMLSGFLPEERRWIDSFIGNGFTDSFRHFNQAGDNYTWWTYRANARAKNLGWRIDYILVANPLATKLKSAQIYSHIEGSDHCPVGVDIGLGG